MDRKPNYYGVHDGYATIRSRGRPRSHAISRTNGKDFPRKPTKAYEVPSVAKSCMILNEFPQVPRWSDSGVHGTLIENYNTMKGGVKKCNLSEKHELRTLNTFASRSNQGRRNSFKDHRQPDDSVRAALNAPIQNDSAERKRTLLIDNPIKDIRNHIYDTVPVELNYADESPANPYPLLKNTFPEGNWKSKTQKPENANLVQPTLTKSKRTEQLNNSNRSTNKYAKSQSDQFSKATTKTDRVPLVNQNRRINGAKEKQSIYAIPNIYSKPNRDRKYIEDINRNIAEIDESYESLKASPASKNSTYGVINKIAKGDLLDRKFYGYHRKRDMAPMPSIATGLIEHIEEKMEKVSNVETESKETLDNADYIDQNTNDLMMPTIRLGPTRSTMSIESIKESPMEHLKDEDANDVRDADLQYDESKKSNNRKNINTEKRRAFSECDSQNRMSSIDDEKRTRCRSIDLLEIDRVRAVGYEEHDKLHLNKGDALGSLNGTANYRRLNGLAGKKCLSNQQLSRRSSESNYLEKKCDTLPYRRSTISPRVGYKSGGDVLDSASYGYNKPMSLQRSCISVDEIAYNRSNAFGDRIFQEELDSHLPMHLMDATDVILEGQLKRAGSSIQNQVYSPRPNYLGTKYSTLRSEKHDMGNSDLYQSLGFSTLPRQSGLLKSETTNNNVRQFSRHILFEPLYEHAVSDLVKLRNRKSAIPWWELATRKYRHRSCPSLQAHVVSAFEQSLSNMTQRLQQLTATAEKKDNELQELRETIERLRKQSAEAGLNNGPSANSGRRHTLGDSDSGTTGCTGNSNQQGASMARQLSADSVTSLNSLSSACSASSHHKKKGWLRSSFSKAFSRSRKNRHGSVSDAEDCKESTGGDLSAPNSPRLPTALKHENARTPGTRSNGQKSPEFENPLTSSKSSSALYKKEDEDVVELKKQLREKDLVLTDIRLEALSSAHQLESLKDTVIKMRNEMLNLKQNNERLQRLVTSKSLTSSQSSLPSDADRRFSMTEVASTVAALANGDNTSNADQLEDMNVPDHPVIPSTTATTGEPVMEQDTDGKRINIAIYLGGEKNFTYNLATGHSSDGSMCEPPHCVIANVCISNKTTWDTLDSTVRRCFKEYVSRVDPVTNLGLGIECLAAYHLGEVSRCITDSQHPELLPCGYLVGHVKTIYVVLSGYSWLAIDTLIPRSIVQRLISLLTEHRRVILCGPSGTGKSYLAGKLAHALVDTDNDTKDAAAVATFNVDHKSSKELRQYLAHIAERCDSNIPDELPKVIILENLQHAASLGELFSGLLGTRHLSCPAIIGTMSQATCSTTNLQLHHNFRWVLCANHMEPVKGFLGRYLRRKLLEYELRETGGTRNAEMAAVVDWLPRVWQHLNKFLETHSSSDVTIGPRLFLSCPMDVAGSQVWFTDLWNYSVIPYLVEAVREGLTLYGRRVSGNGNGNSDSLWEDPTEFIISNYPWISTHAVHGDSEALLRLRPEDVGYDVVPSQHTSGAGASSVKSLGSTHSDTEGDPLLNMLMRLQEAANYSSPHSNDSDSVTSFDSSHTRHSEDLSSSTSSSRGVESAL